MEVNVLYRGLSILPVAPGVSASATADAVATELVPGSHSVAPVGASDGTAASDDGSGQRQDPSHLHAEPPPRVTKFSRDTSTNALVFMEIDPRTQDVIVQFPDEQLLKLKSYLAEMQRHEVAAHQSSPGQVVAKVT